MTEIEEAEFWRKVARRTELPVVVLKRAEALTREGRATWGLGIDGVPASVMIRETEEGLALSVDWMTLSVKALETVEDDPPLYVAGTMALGAMAGAYLGRSKSAAAVGGVLGGIIGALSSSRTEKKGRR